MKKLKKVQLTPVHPVQDTHIFHKISKGLIQRGHEVELLTQHPIDEIGERLSTIARALTKDKIQSLT